MVASTLPLGEIRESNGKDNDKHGGFPITSSVLQLLARLTVFFYKDARNAVLSPRAGKCYESQTTAMSEITLAKND